MLVPKLFTTLRNYNREQFVADLTPGVVVVKRHVPAIDSTGLAALRDVVGRFRRSGTRVGAPAA